MLYSTTLQHFYLFCTQKKEKYKGNKHVYPEKRLNNFEDQVPIIC